MFYPPNPQWGGKPLGHAEDSKSTSLKQLPRESKGTKSPAHWLNEWQEAFSMKQILTFQNVFSFLFLILNGGILKRANNMEKKLAK